MQEIRVCGVIRASQWVTINQWMAQEFDFWNPHIRENSLPHVLRPYTCVCTTNINTHTQWVNNNNEKGNQSLSVLPRAPQPWEVGLISGLLDPYCYSTDCVGLPRRWVDAARRSRGLTKPPGLRQQLSVPQHGPFMFPGHLLRFLHGTHLSSYSLRMLFPHQEVPGR